MRTRTDSGSDDPVEDVIHYTEWDGVCTDYRKPTVRSPWDSKFLRIPRSWTRTTVDYEVPDFYRRRAKGEIFCNPFSSVYVEVLDKAGSVYAKREKPTLTCTGGARAYYGYEGTGSRPSSLACTKAGLTGPYYCAKPTIDVVSLTNLAITQAYSNISESGLDGLATAGEFGKTVDSLKGMFKGFARIARKIKKCDLLGLTGEISPGALRDAYMKFRYDLRPLYYDITGVLKAMESKSPTSKDNRRTYRGFSQQSANITETAIKTSYAQDYDWVTARCQRSVEVRAGVLTDISQLSSLNIWGLDRPLSSAWELIPLSFIVDWFVNVGQTIGSWEPKFGFKELASWTVVKDTSVWNTDISASYDLDTNYPTRSRVMSGGIQKTEIAVTRTPNVQRPILPSFNVKLDGFKLLDLGIIARSLTR